MDPGQLFSVFGEWINSLKYVVESEEEYYTFSGISDSPASSGT
jgi:hypothetical protein